MKTVETLLVLLSVLAIPYGVYIVTKMFSFGDPIALGVITLLILSVFVIFYNISRDVSR